MYFDKDQSLGYKSSMQEIFEKELIHRVGVRINYDDYVEQHSNLSKHMPAEKRTTALLLAGTELDSQFTNPPNVGSDVIKEMEAETILDRPLLQRGTLSSRCPWQDAVALHQDFGDKSVTRPGYLSTEGRYLVNAILKRHYEAIDEIRANHSSQASAKASKKERRAQRKQRTQATIAAIARTVRALHVGHFLLMLMGAIMSFF